MKFVTLVLLFASAGIVVASPSGGGNYHGHGTSKPSKPLPLVTSADLRRTISSRALLEHANKFVVFSKLSNGTRAFGTKTHNATVNYIKKTFDETGYYDTQLQTFSYLFSEGTAEFSANGVAYKTDCFTYGPAGLL